MVKKTMIWILSLGLMLMCNAAWADDFGALVKQSNKDMRTIQRNMYSGKTDAAIELLLKVKDAVAQLKAQKPNDYKVKSLEKKLVKMTKDLEKRTGQDLGGGTTTSSPDGADVVAPAPKAGTKLPYFAQKFIGEASAVLAKAEPQLKQLDDPGFNGDKLALATSLQEVLGEKIYDYKGVAYALNQKKMEAPSEVQELKTSLDQAYARVSAIVDQKASADAAATQAKAGAAQGFETDAEALKDLFYSHDDYLRTFNGRGYTLSSLKDGQEYLAKSKAFEKQIRPELAKALAAFEAKYGKGEDAVRAKARELDHKGRGVSQYTDAAKALANADQSRAAMAPYVLDRAKMEMDRVSKGSAHEFARLSIASSAKEWVSLAHAMDPKNKEIANLNKGMDKWVAKQTKSLQKKIDKARMPKTAGNAPRMSKSAMKEMERFLDQEFHRSKNPKSLLKVVVTGPWRVFKKDVFENPIQWALPATVAVQSQGDKSLDLARMYNISVLTEKRAGVKQEPPFGGVTVGDSQYIRSKAVR